VSGPLRRQGQDAYDGIRLWVDHANRPLRLVALDDASSASRARENVARLLTEERVDLLLGPYGSGSTLAVAPLAAAHGKILWNHGGAADEITEAGSAHVVSVLSPASTIFETCRESSGTARMRSAPRSSTPGAALSLRASGAV